MCPGDSEHYLKYEVVIVNTFDPAAWSPVATMFQNAAMKAQSDGALIPWLHAVALPQLLLAMEAQDFEQQSMITALNFTCFLYKIFVKRGVDVNLMKAVAYFGRSVIHMTYALWQKEQLKISAHQIMSMKGAAIIFMNSVNGFYKKIKKDGNLGTLYQHSDFTCEVGVEIGGEGAAAGATTLPPFPLSAINKGFVYFIADNPELFPIIMHYLVGEVHTEPITLLAYSYDNWPLFVSDCLKEISLRRAGSHTTMLYSKFEVNIPSSISGGGISSSSSSETSLFHYTKISDLFLSGYSSDFCASLEYISPPGTWANSSFFSSVPIPVDVNTLSLEEHFVAPWTICVDNTAYPALITIMKDIVRHIGYRMLSNTVSAAHRGHCKELVKGIKSLLLDGYITVSGSPEVRIKFKYQLDSMWHYYINRVVAASKSKPPLSKGLKTLHE